MPIKLIQINGAPQAAKSIATDRPPALQMPGETRHGKDCIQLANDFCRNHWIRGIGLGARRRERTVVRHAMARTAREADF